MRSKVTTRRASAERAHAAAKAALALAVALIAVPAGQASAHSHKPQGGDVVAGRYIVVYKGSVSGPDAETDRRERTLGFAAKYRYRSAAKGFAAQLSEGQVRKLRADPVVAFVTPDRVVRALGAVPLVAGESVPTGVRRIQAGTGAWAHEASGAAVAVVDSGVDLAHPDLNAANGTNCVTPGAPAQDDNGHGTHVAGTIAAKNNGAGVVGVAPGTRIYAVKVLDAAGSGSWATVMCGIDWVAANAAARGIKVSNLSLGGLGTNDNACGATNGDALHASICRANQAGILHVVAAGNSGWDIGDSPPDVPAAYPEVLAVTALSDSDGTSGGRGIAPSCKTDERDDASATFSNYATRAADAARMVAAPGVCIVSTWPGGGYATSSGTSMAAPHIAGLAALCLSEGGAAGPCAGKAPAEIRAHLRADAQAYSTANPGYGFAGDPLRPNQWGDFFGYASRAAQDTTPPRARLVAAPPEVTRSSAARFEFAGDAGARFECRLDGAAWAACSSPANYSGLVEGAHVFEVRGVDVVGNTDLTPARAAFSVDTTPPDTAISSGPGSLTNVSRPTFDFAANETGSRFECRVDAGAWAACATPHTTGTLADGAHTFEVRASDGAGNTDTTPAGRSFTVDATAPSAWITTGPADPTKNTTPTFEFAASEVAARLDCRIDGGAWTACASPHRTGELAPGRHAFEVRAVDAAGNASALAGWQFTVDTTTTSPPVATTPEPTVPASPTPNVPASPEPTVPVSPAPTVPAPPAPEAPPATSTPAAPADRAAPVVSLSVRRQTLRAVRTNGLRVAVASSERFAGSATLVLDGRTAKRVGLSRGSAVVVGRVAIAWGAERRTVVVRLSARARTRLARIASVWLTVSVTARDAAGNSRGASRRVALSR